MRIAGTDQEYVARINGVGAVFGHMLPRTMPDRDQFIEVVIMHGIEITVVTVRVNENAFFRFEVSADIQKTRFDFGHDPLLDLNFEKNISLFDKIIKVFSEF